MINPHLDYGLYLLVEMLESAGKTLEMCSLPIPQYNWHPLNNLIDWELAYNLWDEAKQEAEKLAQLNMDQHSCFQTILHAVDSNYSENPYFFI